MTHTSEYKTKQREELISYMETLGGEHVTVSDIVDRLRSRGIRIGVTTVYRHLEKMVKEGIVKKYVIDGVVSACFEYTGKNNDFNDLKCFHFKCEKCGKLIHFYCKSFEDVQMHMLKDHGFDINSLRTVFYGTCDRCNHT